VQRCVAGSFVRAKNFVRVTRRFLKRCRFIAPCRDKEELCQVPRLLLFSVCCFFFLFVSVSRAPHLLPFSSRERRNACQKFHHYLRASDRVVLLSWQAQRKRKRERERAVSRSLARGSKVGGNVWLERATSSRKKSQISPKLPRGASFLANAMLAASRRRGEVAIWTFAKANVFFRNTSDEERQRAGERGPIAFGQRGRQASWQVCGR